MLAWKCGERHPLDNCQASCCRTPRLAWTIRPSEPRPSWSRSTNVKLTFGATWTRTRAKRRWQGEGGDGRGDADEGDGGKALGAETTEGKKR